MYPVFEEEDERKNGAEKGKGDPWPCTKRPPSLFFSPRTQSSTKMISTDVLYHSFHHGNLSPIPPTLKSPPQF